MAACTSIISSLTLVVNACGPAAALSCSRSLPSRSSQIVEQQHGQSLQSHTTGSTKYANSSIAGCLYTVCHTQVFRTEHYSHAIKTSKSSGPLGLIAIIVSTIAAVALVLTAIVHPGEIQNTLLHPQQSFNLMMSPQFPWRQIAFTGLLSTDFVIYIEVRQLYGCCGDSRSLCLHTPAWQLSCIYNSQGRAAFASCHTGHNAISTPAT